MRKVHPKVTGLSSASNALRLLSLLTERPSLRVVDAAKHLDVAPSTAHRLLSCLRDEGFLQQEDGSRRYAIGPEMLRLARHVTTQHALENIAHDYLEALSREVHETVNLQILLGTDVLCIDTVAESRHTLHVKQIAGQRTPAHASAAGKVLLSVLDPPDIHARYRDGMSSVTKRTIADLDSFQRELEAVRTCGYSTNMGEREEGVHAVAVGVMDPRQRPMAALSVAAPATRLPAARIKNIVSQMRRTSAAITAAFFAVHDSDSHPADGG